jgi:hypothetical protein
MTLWRRPLKQIPFSFAPVPVVHFAPMLTPIRSPSCSPVQTAQFQKERYGHMPRPKSCTAWQRSGSIA